MTLVQLYAAAAEAAYHATQAVRAAQGGPRAPLWTEIDAAEQARWRAWVQHVIHGVVVDDADEVGASVARALARACGFAPTSRALTAQRVIGAVARYFDLPAEALTGPRRLSTVSDARHLAMLLARRAGLSYPVIGRAFGNRDHTTVMSAVRKMEGLVETTFQDTYRVLAAELDLPAPAPAPPASGPTLAAPAPELLHAG